MGLWLRERANENKHKKGREGRREKSTARNYVYASCVLPFDPSDSFFDLFDSNDDVRDRRNSKSEFFNMLLSSIFAAYLLAREPYLTT